MAQPAAPRPRTFGCCVPHEVATGYLHAASGAQPLTRDMIDMRKHSASEAFDYAFAQTLGMLCEYFHVLPSFAYYQEAGGTLDCDAKATDVILFGRDDGTVLFGLNMLTKQMAGNYGTYGVMAVAAHEFGHIVAKTRGLNEKLAPSMEAPFRAEQFADFMCGVFSAYRRRDNKNFEANYFAMTMRELGTLNRETHGTKQERGFAVAAGYRAAWQTDQDFDEIVKAGYDYAMAMT